MANFNIGQLPGQQFYSRVKIKGQEIASTNIKSLVIREWVLDILPIIELKLSDMGALLEFITLEDNDEIEVILAKDEDSEDQLNMVFMLSDYQIAVASDNRMYEISIVGHLKVSDMFYVKTKSFNKNSSLDVLSKIAQDSGLSFSNPLGVTTNDKMTWYQLNSSNYEFIKHVLRRSYIFNDVLFFYADHTNKFIATSLNKEIDKRSNKKMKFSVENTESKNDVNDKTIYFDYYDFVNLAGTYNKKTSYGVSINYYDSSEPKVIEYNTAKKLSSLTFIDKTYFGKPVRTDMGGVYNNLNLYSEKYYESIVRNEYLINNFFSYSLVVNINSNEDIKLFDMIDVTLPSIVTEDINEVYSGKYLVGGIIHNITNGSVYKKILSLHRNGMNRSSEVKFPRVK